MIERRGLTLPDSTKTFRFSILRYRKKESMCSYRQEPQILNDESRAASSGSFIALKKGTVHYEIAGPKTGSKADPKGRGWVVFLPGVSVPCGTWNRNFFALADEGFGCLRFDFYGRGLSDRIDGRYDLDFFVDQLRELLDALSIVESVNLVALSMGGAVAARFSILNPGRVRRIFFIDPLFRAPEFSPFMRLLLLPGIGEILLAREKILVSGQEADFFNSADFEDFKIVYRPQLRYRGFRRALLSTLRSILRWEITGNYERLAASGIPTALVRGRHDRTIPADSFEILARLLKPELYVVVDEAGHVPHYEKPDLVNGLVADFLG
jgi:pimeloyl-ACP methyl ester carboxylesterase